MSSVPHLKSTKSCGSEILNKHEPHYIILTEKILETLLVLVIFQNLSNFWVRDLYLFLCPKF